MVILGAVVLHPFSVPPLNVLLLKLYVKVPLNEPGGVLLLVFFAYSATVAVLIPGVPLLPAAPASETLAPVHDMDVGVVVRVSEYLIIAW